MQNRAVYKGRLGHVPPMNVRSNRSAHSGKKVKIKEKFIMIIEKRTASRIEGRR